MDAPAADAAATAAPANGEPTSAAAPAPKPPLQQFLETVLRVGAAEAPTHVVPQIADKRGQRKKVRGLAPRRAALPAHPHHSWPC